MAKQKNNSQTQSVRIRPTMRQEAIHPADYNRYNLPYACEDCVHFANQSVTCTLGLNPVPHLRSTQRKTYEMNGHMALCRFQEID